MTLVDDDAALKLAWEYASREPMRAAQLQDKLDGLPNPRGGWFISPEPWRKVAEFAAHCAQFQSLSLKPWERAPCDGDPNGDRPPDKLLRKMLDAGVSRYHPDPARALKEAGMKTTEGPGPVQREAAH